MYLAFSKPLNFFLMRGLCVIGNCSAKFQLNFPKYTWGLKGREWNSVQFRRSGFTDQEERRAQ